MGRDDDISFGPKNSSNGLLFFVAVLIIAILAFSFIRENPTAVESTGLFIQQPKTIVANQIDSYFCPEDECADKLISQIDSSKNSIYIAIYSFTHDGISDALVRAHKRGVEIKVVFDYDQSKNDYSDDEKLVSEGILVKRRDGSGYMHNKFAVIDGNIVATGSFNYSENANTKNDENLLIIFSAELAKAFLAEFNELWEQSLK
jgi:phosphatidylserine/phosphatidylglycerophosphate/cardiolipin synthase-like enzyme